MLVLTESLVACSDCGWNRTVEKEPVRHRCPVTGEVLTWVPKDWKGTQPGLARRVGNFAVAATHHVLTGARKTSDEVVAERWAHCIACQYFKALVDLGEGRGQCTHASCGCAVESLGNESTLTPNKLRWAEQACPIGKWGPV